MLLTSLLVNASTSASFAQYSLAPAREPDSIRVATYNASMNRPGADSLTKELRSANPQIAHIAAVIRSVQPDILLINEIDYSDSADNAALFADNFLAIEQRDVLGNSGWDMPYRYSAPVNTGVASGMDLNKDGRIDSPEDAWGFGRFPGQYGMAVLSRFEIDSRQVRTFQKLRWAELPQAMRPYEESGKPYHSDETWNALRLSSKSFWDVPIRTPSGAVHALVSHPTPPAFDGPEDRNGCRNHDEIRLVYDYISGADYLRDDRGTAGGLPREQCFVVLGDLNSDPFDGGSKPSAIQHLLGLPEINPMAAPTSRGAATAAQQQGRANLAHRGPHNEDTADFSDRSVGNLRVDYALPSASLEVIASGTVWPALEDLPESRRAAVATLMKASDHHLVWVDVRFEEDGKQQ